MDTNELIFLNALNSVPGVGIATLRLLKNNLGNFENAWKNDIRFLAAGPFIQPIARIIAARAIRDPEKEFLKLERNNLWLITDDDPLFPPSLREIPQPPLILYGCGQKPSYSKTMIGVVGTRRPTPYGREVAKELTTGLSRAGIIIVSGLAVGIDAVAHQTALEEQAITVAVVGSGLDAASLFPSQHVALAERIATSGGTVISEYAPETPATKEHFPLRNRIISGLSRGVVVVEARERSGALITARTALEQNRDVFAVPGSIFSPTSRGANLLIQEGARIVTSCADIFDEWDMDIHAHTMRAAYAGLDTSEQSLVKILEHETTIDGLREKTGFDTASLISALSLLELKGIVRNLGSDTYQAISP